MYHEDDGSPFEQEQDRRRFEFELSLESTANAIKKAMNFVSTIIHQNAERMLIDEQQKLVILGSLAIYRVDLESFLTKLNNPFYHASLDTVEVHPLSGFVKVPHQACVQVRQTKKMPAGDSFAAYLLGLMNDEKTWLNEDMRPLRDALFRTYGYVTSPLTASWVGFLQHTYDGILDLEKSNLMISGTNGWKWRLHYGNPLTLGIKIEYQKPRQTWWNIACEDSISELLGHYELGNMYSAIQHLSACPKLLMSGSDWESDMIFMRKIALDYPPLARRMLQKINEEDYDVDGMYIDWEEPISRVDAQRVKDLDNQLRTLAEA